jgi:hypothetical protein
MRGKIALLGAFLGLALTAVPAWAHHSFTAEFDPDKSFTVKGVLKHVDWTNPHVYFYVDVKDENGNVETWSFQSFPPGMLHRAGVQKDVFRIGEEVTVLANPAKDGTKHLGSGNKIRYSDGHEVLLLVAGRNYDKY